MKSKFAFILIMSCWFTINYAQDSPNFRSDTIDLPQVSKYITTNINRNTLRYDAAIIRGGNFNLSGSIAKFISDETKQIRIYGRLNKSFNIDELRRLDRHLNSGTFGASAKFFNKKNHFIEVSLDNSGILLNPGNNLPIRSNHEVSLGFGLGRIDFVNDAIIARRILKELSETNQISRIPNEEEFKQLVKVIGQIKDERYFENRSYSNFEPYQILMLLDYFEITNSTIDILSRSIHQSFKYEPIINRKVGFELKILARSGIFQKGLFDEVSRQNVRLGISWDYNNYVNDFWQWSMSFSALTAQRSFEFSPILDTSIKNIGLFLQNHLHYLPNSTTRISLINFISSSPIVYFGDVVPRYRRDYSLYTGMEIEFLTSRRTSITFNFSRSVSRENNSSTNWGIMLKF